MLELTRAEGPEVSEHLSKDLLGFILGDSQCAMEIGSTGIWNSCVNCLTLSSLAGILGPRTVKDLKHYCALKRPFWVVGGRPRLPVGRPCRLMVGQVVGCAGRTAHYTCQGPPYHHTSIQKINLMYVSEETSLDTTTNGMLKKYDSRV